jgi:hypothetical protein
MGRVAPLFAHSDVSFIGECKGGVCGGDKIARWIGREYEVVLELLKIIETEFGIEGMDGGGNIRGQGARVAMQWRVFEMLESKRREEVKGVEERVLECRMRVSGELLDIIEGLKEEF